MTANTSYDRIFKWIGQGQIGFVFPLGKSFQSKPSYPLRNSFIVFPNHADIVVVKRRKKISPAINPETGLPYYFLFVNNQHPFSDGSIEDPFGSLGAAEAVSRPNDVIYVFRGDGTTAHMSAGITLKNYQKFLGSGTSHQLSTTVGTVTIPAQTSDIPIITNTGGSGVTLAQFNTVSGFHIDQTNLHGIEGTAISNATITNNLITNSNTSNTADGSGISIIGPGMNDTFYIQNNIITGTTPEMHGIFLTPDETDNCFFDISFNSITVPKDGAEIKPLGTSQISLQVFGNQFTATTAQRGFFLETHNSSSVFFVFSNNTFRSTGSTALFLQGRSSSIAQGSIVNNQCISSSTGLRIAPDKARYIVNANKNSFSNNTTNDFRGDIAASGTTGYFCLALDNNQAPALGFVLEKDSASATFNLQSFENNTGDLSTTGVITRDSSCP